MTFNNRQNIINPQEPNDNHSLYSRACQLLNNNLLNRNVDNIYSDLIDNYWNERDIYAFFLEFYDIVDNVIMSLNTSEQQWNLINRWDINPEIQLRDIDNIIRKIYINLHV
jgi:hypothetical protein